MTLQRWRILTGSLLLCLVTGLTHADKLDDDLQTVWESLWDQRGTPRQLVRWDKPIHYRIHGSEASRHRAHIESALRAATDAARMQIVDVSAQADAEAVAMLDIEVVKDGVLQETTPCYTHHLKWTNWAYDKTLVKMRSRDAWRCAFHEMMHVMGVLGHPSGKTVLSYFPYRSDVLMNLDQLMLAAWYSPAMPKGATPLDALAVLSEAVARQTDLGLPPDEASRRAQAFNLRMLKQMEALASGHGEVPDIVMRSGRASHDFIKRAEPVAAYFVGLAHSKGVIASKDAVAAAPWFKRAALKGHSGAQVLWARALIAGAGTEADPLSAHTWLALAAKGGNSFAKNELSTLEQTLKPEELDKARAMPAPAMDPS